MNRKHCCFHKQLTIGLTEKDMHNDTCYCTSNNLKDMICLAQPKKGSLPIGLFVYFPFADNLHSMISPQKMLILVWTSKKRNVTLMNYLE